VKELIQCLIYIEELAGNFYLDAAKYFNDDNYLSKVLSSLAEDEASHFHILSSAERYLDNNDVSIDPEIAVDDELKEKIEFPLKENIKLLESNILSKRDIIQCIGQTEFSEWNDLFLYVVNTLKSYSRLYQFIASEVQNHRKKVEQFLMKFEEGKDFLEKIKELPMVWESNILIIDDSEPILELLVSLFEKEYLVETALNGKDGLKKIKKDYYNLIISDIDMPKMNGIELFKQASKYEDQLGSRFIFFSSSKSQKDKNFIKENDLEIITKPANLRELKSRIKSKI